MSTLETTPHNKALKSDIAKVVIMPGDPLRAKYIAKTFLTNVKQVNKVRNMFMYTGEYHGSKVTIAGSGMGMPSIGIYSYEFFKFYDVDCIIRIGSAGAYQKHIDLYDVINVERAYSESNFAKIAAHGLNSQQAAIVQKTIINSDNKLYEMINDVASAYDNQQVKSENKINLKTGMIHSSDVFYHFQSNYYQTNSQLRDCLGVEMEAFALFTNAILLNKRAACILTVSDSLVTKAALSADLREISFHKMIILALKTAQKYYQSDKK